MHTCVNAQITDNEALQKLPVKRISFMAGVEAGSKSLEIQMDSTAYKVCNMTIREFCKKHPEVNQYHLDAFATKLSSDVNISEGTIYIVDIAKIKNDVGKLIDRLKVRNLATYKISFNKLRRDDSIVNATINEKLLALEEACSAQLMADKNTNEKSEDFKFQSDRLYKSIIDGLKKNSPDAVRDFNSYIKFVKTRNIYKTYAYQKLTKNLMDRLKWDLEVCKKIKKPMEVIKLIENYYIKASELNDLIQNRPLK